MAFLSKKKLSLFLLINVDHALKRNIHGIKVLPAALQLVDTCAII
jgi:hypothetical protein